MLIKSACCSKSARWSSRRAASRHRCRRDTKANNSIDPPHRPQGTNAITQQPLAVPPLFKRAYHAGIIQTHVQLAAHNQPPLPPPTVALMQEEDGRPGCTVAHLRGCHVLRLAGAQGSESFDHLRTAAARGCGVFKSDTITAQRAVKACP